MSICSLRRVKGKQVKGLYDLVTVCGEWTNMRIRSHWEDREGDGPF